MNPNTGEIRAFMTQAEAELKGYTIPLGREPKSSCNKCYGRGYDGINDEGQYVPCSCTKPITQSLEDLEEKIQNLENGDQSKGR